MSLSGPEYCCLSKTWNFLLLYQVKNTTKSRLLSHLQLNLLTFSDFLAHFVSLWIQTTLHSALIYILLSPEKKCFQAWGFLVITLTQHLDSETT